MKPVIQFLSGEEIRKLHGHAIRLLEEVGMRLPLKESLDLLTGAGAEIMDDGIVRIPEKLVRSALETVPKRNDVVLQNHGIR